MNYCSVLCCTAHKQHCSKPELGKNDATTLNTQLDNGNDNISVLSLNQKQSLKRSREIKSYLISTRLRKKLCSIDSSANRQIELRKARENPEFEEFVQVLLQSINQKS
jgi:hypothetical protein